MNENFNSNNENSANNIPEEEKRTDDIKRNDVAEEKNQPVGSENVNSPQYNSEPVTPPVTPPNYSGQQGYASTHVPYGNGNVYNNNPSQQYMPYSSYQNPMRPEAPKKPSKGKKKGLIIAVSILCVILVVSIALVVAVAIKKASQLNSMKDDTRLPITGETEIVEEEATDGKALTSKQVYDKVYNSSVGLLVYSGAHQRAVGEGSGIVMGLSGDKKGTYIITCAHVVQTPSPKVTVQTHDGTQYEGKVVGIDSKTDIGLVYVNSTDLKSAEFADTSSLSVGDKVYAIGNPGGMQFFGSFTDGMISAIGRPVNSPVGYEVECIQHTAAINPGNSGGALVNDKGQVIGINSSKIASTEYEGMGFAVPTATVKEVVDQLIANGRVINRPVLGIKFAPVMSNQTYSIIAQSNDLPAGSIIVNTIMKGSDLANKGVKPGDIITEANGKDLDSYEELLNIVENGKVGDTVKLTVCKVDANYKITETSVNVKLVSDSEVTEPKEEQPELFPFPFGR